jgi:threonine aldolase
VLELERLAASLLGKDDALFMPSGTMANLAAVIGHQCHGGEVIVEASAHIYNSEGGGLSVLGGAVARPVKGFRGALKPVDIEAALIGRANTALAPTKLICLETSHNAAGGAVLPLDNMSAVRAVAQEAGLPIHLDGARLFNAAAHLDVPVADICKHVDSVWFALCKGLGAPVGAILAGDEAFMQRARRAAKLLGGGMRQAGIIAAPGIVALKEPYAVLKRDHALARKLAYGLAAIDSSLVDLEGVQTNIVNCMVGRFAENAGVINRALKEGGILANHKGTKIRFVTHYHIDEAAVDAAISRAAEVIGPLRRAA